MFAPIANRWHTLVLNRIVLENRRWATVFLRVGVDQTLFAPLATCLFYGSQGILESRPWSASLEVDGQQGIKERLGERLVPTVMKQWMVISSLTSALRSNMVSIRRVFTDAARFIRFSAPQGS